MTPTDHHDARHREATYLRTAEEDDARLQPDPELALSEGKASRSQIWMVTLGTLLVLGVVLYGVTQTSKESRIAATPPIAETTGAAPSDAAPFETPQPTPPQQAAPEPAKPGPGDSTR